MIDRFKKYLSSIINLGVTETNTNDLNKVIKLCNAIAIAILMVNIIRVITLKEYYNDSISLFRAFLGFSTAFFVFFLNYLRLYLSARYTLLLCFATALFLRSVKFELATGEYFYYFPLIVLCLLSFQNESRFHLFSSILIAIGSICIIEGIDWSSYSHLQEYSTTFTTQARVINLCLSLIGTTLVLYFYINLSNTQIKKNQEDLITTLNSQKLQLEEANTVLIDQVKNQNMLLISSQQSLIQAKEYGKLGLWYFDVLEGTINWDEEVFRSFEMDSLTDKTPSFEEYMLLIHEEDRELLLQKVNEAILTKGEFNVELRQKQTKTNTYRWFLAKGKVSLNNQDQVIALEGINIDINDLVVTQLKLSESENALEQLLKSSAAGIALIDKGVVTYSNESMSKMVGYDSGDFINFKLQSILHADFQDLLNLDLSKKEIINSISNQDMILIQRDGNHLDVSVSCELITYKGKSVICATVIDISNRKSYENELVKKEQEAILIQNTLKQQNELFEYLYDNIPVILVLVDQNGRIIKQNKHFTTILGYQENEVEVINQIFGANLPELGPYWKEVTMTDKNRQSKITNWVLIKLSNGLNLMMGEDITQEKIDKDKIGQTLVQLTELNASLAKNEEFLKQSNVALYENNKLLKESEHKTKIISEYTFEAIFVLNKGGIMEANEMALKLFEVNIEELKETPLLSLVIPSQREYFNDIIFQEINDPTEITFISKNGTLFYGELRGSSFQYQLQEIKVITIRDITERKQKEQQIRESESNMRQIFDSLPIGLLIGQNSASVLYNTTLIRLLELEKDYSGSLAFDNFIHPDYKESFNLWNAIELQSQMTSKELEIEIVTIQGQRKFVILSRSFVRYRHQLTPIISVLDISEKKAVDDNLRKSYAYQYSILNSGKMGYWATDLDYNVLFCNDYHQLMMKNTFGKVMEIGKSVLEFLPNQDYIDEYVQNTKNVIERGEGAVYIKEIVDMHGVSHYGEYYMNPIYQEGQVNGILVRAKDITEQILANKKVYESEERLRESQKIAKIGCWEFDPFTKEIIWSDEMFEIHDEDASYLPTFEANSLLIGKENQDYLDRLAFEAIKNGNKWKHECFITTSKNINKWVRIIGIPIYDDNHNLIKLRGTTQDITENKITELKVRENEELLEAIIENLPVAFQMYDSNGYSLRMNDVQRNFLGIEPNNHNAIYNILEDNLHYDPDFITELKVAFKGEKLKFDRLKVNSSAIENKTDSKYLDIIFLPVFDQFKNLKLVIYLGIEVTEAVLKEKELGLKHQELIETTKKIAEYRMMALRSVMNPHFLFNSLNSIQYFIAKNERELALTYLSLFSKLVRKILESSISTKISLSDELSILRYYVELENLRFDNKFAAIFDIESSINTEEIEVPSLVLQPYVENSVIHGLLNKDKGQGILKIKIVQKDDLLLCTIEDNGIGRTAASYLKNGIDHKSIGMKVTEERLRIINKIDDVSVNIIDLFDEQGNAIGTRNEVVIRIFN